MNRTNPKVDGYLRKLKKWQQELTALRSIILDSPLTEEVKWRQPCYTFDGHNVLIVGAFKDCCVLNFFKGALLKDPKRVLVKPGENSQSSRIIRFASVQQIQQAEPALKSLVRQAIEVEKAGLKVKLKTIEQHKAPQELQSKLDENPAFKAAFKALTPGRQRAYILHFSAPKQSTTRQSRIEKCIPQILNGKGFMDDYLQRGKARRPATRLARQAQ